MEELATKVMSAIALIRPFLNEDGGDVELVEITRNGEVKVRLTGSCRDCSMKQSTLRGGIEETIRKAVPEIKAVIAVED
ncbi:MAG: NifU family protein [Bacteroidetes bacterium]|nr:NifU family protein [Bacteroidota bacterium]